MSGAGPAAGATRLLALDALRGVAVFLMIEQHLGVWLWDADVRAMRSHPELVAFNALGGGAAPMFIVLAGMGSALMVAERGAAGAPIDRTLFTRGVILFAFGYLLDLCTPSWFSLASWFVLHLMGLGMMLTPLLRRLPTPVLFALAAAILLATGPLQAWIGTPQALTNPYMSARAEHVPAWAPLRIALAEGQFPVFPWLSVFVLGLACGRFVSAQRLKPVVVTALTLLALGGLAVLLWKLGLFERGTAAWRTVRIRVPFFPAAPSLVCLIAGAVLLAIAGMIVWDRRRPLTSSHPLVTFGRASLTLLLVHVVVFRELSRPLGLWRGLSAGSAMAVLFGFVLAAAVASWAWRRADYRYGAEWLLRRLAR